jgi:hypothetical protein
MAPLVACDGVVLSPGKALRFLCSREIPKSESRNGVTDVLPIDCGTAGLRWDDDRALLELLSRLSPI